MTRFMWTFVLLGLAATSGQAQFPSRPSGSGSSGGYGGSGGGIGSSNLMGGIGTAPSGVGFSPYLNLFSGRASAAVNLYGIVRPQQSLQQGLQSLQQSYIAGGGAQDEASGGIAVIGTKVRFLDTGGYFLNIAGGTTATSGASGGGSGFSRPRSGAGGGLNSFGSLPSSGSLSLPEQGSLGGSGTGSFGAPAPKGGGRPSNKNN